MRASVGRDGRDDFASSADLAPVRNALISLPHTRRPTALTDINPDARPHIPFAVTLLGMAILATFLLTGQWNVDASEGLYERFGVIPMRYEPHSPYPFNSTADAALPLFTHVFMHAGLPHIFMNGLAYVQAAPIVAWRMGGARFLALFFLSALGGALAFILINPHSQIAAIGASGAICGLFAALFLAMRPTPQQALADPRVRNAMLMFLGINVVLFAILPVGIAWQAHLGGFITGAVAYLVLAPRKRMAGPWA